jgi:hypothetical protein
MPRPALPLAALALTLLAPASPSRAAEAALPATMTVEVVSLRQGKPFRRTLAKVRPGDSVLLRDETSTPFVSAVDSRGTRTENAVSGLVATVIPSVRAGRLYLDFASTVREVGSFDTARVPVPGKPDAVISLPSVSQKSYEASVEPAFADGEWRAVQTLGESGFGVSVVAKPLKPGSAPLAPVPAAAARR